MADTRVKDAPDAPADLTGYYVAVDKDGQPSFERVLVSDIIEQSKNEITGITPPTSASISEIVYGRYNKASKVSVLQVEFVFATGGVTDPQFLFNVAAPTAIIDSKIIVNDSSNGFYFATISGLTPLAITLPKTFTSGSFTVTIEASIVL